jgi:hypothetical protein
MIAIAIAPPARIRPGQTPLPLVFHHICATSRILCPGNLRNPFKVLSDIRGIPIAFLLLVVSTNIQHNLHLRKTTPPSSHIAPW